MHIETTRPSSAELFAIKWWNRVPDLPHESRTILERKKTLLGDNRDVPENKSSHAARADHSSDSRLESAIAVAPISYPYSSPPERRSVLSRERLLVFQCVETYVRAVSRWVSFISCGVSRTLHAPRRAPGKRTTTPGASSVSAHYHPQTSRAPSRHGRAHTATCSRRKQLSHLCVSLLVFLCHVAGSSADFSERRQKV